MAFAERSIARWGTGRNCDDRDKHDSSVRCGAGAMVALALCALLCADCRRVRTGRDDRTNCGHRHRRAAAAGRRRQRDRHSRAVGHQLRGDDARGWAILHSQHAGRRSLHGHGRLHRGRYARRSSRRRVQDVMVNLGVATDIPIHRAARLPSRKPSRSRRSPIRSSARRAPAPRRRSAATKSRRCRRCPARINDITRLTPQASGMSFGGQDNRLNNITVDGSYFNNSFGLAGAPGERTGVAPISLEAIEQVQVNVAPFDVRQGNFVGAGVNTVTRSGTNRFTGSVYHRFRNQDFVGTEAQGLAVQSRDVQVPRHWRLGRRPDHPEPAVRLRQLRRRDGHAAAHHVQSQRGRGARRRVT